MIRVVVADDQELVRRGFTVLLGTAPDLEVVGEASDGEEAIEVARRLQPDVILMDIRMPGMDGVEATRRIVADDAIDARVLILTTFDLDEYVFESLLAGASGFLLKDASSEELIAAIRVIAVGESLLAPRATRRLVEEFTRMTTPGRKSVDVDLSALTPRELEVLSAVARGRSNAEIAEDLYMSAATAKTHVSRLFTKLAVRDRAQLVMLAYEAGIVTPGTP